MNRFSICITACLAGLFASSAMALTADKPTSPAHVPTAAGFTWNPIVECEMSVKVKGQAIPGALRWDITYRNEYGNSTCNVLMDYPAQIWHNATTLDPSFAFNFQPQSFDPDHRFVSVSTPSIGACNWVQNDARFADKPTYMSCTSTLSPGQATSVTLITSGLRAPPYRYCIFAGVGAIQPPPTTVNGITFTHLQTEPDLGNNITADCVDVYKTATQLKGVILESMPPEPIVNYPDPHWREFEVIGGDYDAPPSANVVKDIALPAGFQFSRAYGDGWTCTGINGGATAHCTRSAPTAGLFPRLLITMFTQ